MHRLNGEEAAVRRSADLGKLTSSTELGCKQSGSEPSVRGNGGFDTDAAPSRTRELPPLRWEEAPHKYILQFGEIHFAILTNTMVGSKLQLRLGVRASSDG